MPRKLTLALFLLLVGCTDEPGYDPESPWVEGELGVWRAGLTVGEAGGCSTAIVAGLSRQLLEEIGCLRPGVLSSIAELAVSADATTWLFLQTPARNGLAAALVDRGGTLSLTSVLRTLPQQFLLYRWYQQGRCGITLAARPGRSAHESGLALDTSQYAAWRAALERHGWDWYGEEDVVHFTFRGGGTTDLAGLSVLAFQRLWNRNHPEDLIDEDGLYGPQTEARISRSPADGFVVGPCPVAPPVDADRDGTPAEADCDDHDPAIHPGADEQCNGRDDDCDGATDEYPACGEPDEDGDGAERDRDCDDGDPTVHPGADERCNGRDDDCDGETDEYPACGEPDEDGDGAERDRDCDDGDPAVHPGAAERCNGRDDDCDGATDEGAACAEPDAGLEEPDLGPVDDGGGPDEAGGGGSPAGGWGPDAAGGADLAGDPLLAGASRQDRLRGAGCGLVAEQARPSPGALGLLGLLLLALGRGRLPRQGAAASAARRAGIRGCAALAARRAGR